MPGGRSPSAFGGRRKQAHGRARRLLPPLAVSRGRSPPAVEVPGLIFGTPRAKPCHQAAGETTIAACPPAATRWGAQRRDDGLDERVQIPPAGLPVLQGLQQQVELVGVAGALGALTTCLQSQIGRDRHLRRQETVPGGAAVALPVVVRWGPARTAVNGTVVARLAGTSSVVTRRRRR